MFNYDWFKSLPHPFRTSRRRSSRSQRLEAALESRVLLSAIDGLELPVEEVVEPELWLEETEVVAAESESEASFTEGETVVVALNVRRVLMYVPEDQTDVEESGDSEIADDVELTDEAVYEEWYAFEEYVAEDPYVYALPPDSGEYEFPSDENVYSYDPELNFPPPYVDPQFVDTGVIENDLELAEPTDEVPVDEVVNDSNVDGYYPDDYYSEPYQYVLPPDSGEYEFPDLGYDPSDNPDPNAAVVDGDVNPDDILDSMTGGELPNPEEGEVPTDESLYLNPTDLAIEDSPTDGELPSDELVDGELNPDVIFYNMAGGDLPLVALAPGDPEGVVETTDTPVQELVYGPFLPVSEPASETVDEPVDLPVDPELDPDVILQTTAGGGRGTDENGIIQPNFRGNQTTAAERRAAAFLRKQERAAQRAQQAEARQLAIQTRRAARAARRAARLANR